MAAQGLRALALAVACLTLPAVLSAQSDDAPPIDRLIADLQTRYDGVRDFSARFEHEYTGGLINVSVVEHGTVDIKKPGRMRWRYTSAEEKLYVSDGETFYAHFPIDRQVVVTALPSDDRASTPTLFLAGRGRLAEDFVATYDAEAPPPDAWLVRLVPRAPNADYAWLRLTVDRDTLAITGLETEDLQGGRSSYRFHDLSENQGLADDLFVFEIPPDTDVIVDEVR